MKSLEARAREGKLLYDCAKGTNLAEFVKEPGDPTDILNIQAPQRVLAFHEACVHAGSELIQTNTFNANMLRMALHGANVVYDINVYGALLAREAAGQDAYVAGDIGPSGKILLPAGDTSQQELFEAFAVQAEALIHGSGGAVDAIHIETISDVAEAKEAINAVRTVDQAIPIFVTMSFDMGKPDHPKTMFGYSPSLLKPFAQQEVLFAYGANCGTGIKNAGTIVELFNPDVSGPVVVMKMNAGLPKVVGGVVVYDATPHDMGLYARAMHERGVAIIGACCGSTPAHLEAMANALAKVR